MDFATPRHHQQHFLLKVIKTSCQTKFVETPPYNLIHFVELVWKNNKNLITTPVLESLVLSICPTAPTEYDVALKKKDILYLWNLLKHIGHYQTGILNTRILNQLIGFFRYMGKGRMIVGGYSFYGYIWDKGKAALDVFHKFEVFQCVPNQDTYIFTLQAICGIDYSTDVLQQAASICQKMVLQPDTLLPDDGKILGRLLTWFSKNNMIKEAYALYRAANEKRKRNPNWGLELDRLLPHRIFEFDTLCSRKETVYLALDLLTVIDIHKEVEHKEEGTKLSHCRKVITALCQFKDFDAAKQLIFKMIADGPLQRPSKEVFNVIIKTYVDAREIGQALEMVMLLESIGLHTYDALTCGNGSYYSYMTQAKEILEEAKKKDSKLIVALLYHMLIVDCDFKQNYDKALKLLTEMKDFGLQSIWMNITN
ncbi:putative pentatricopeptide [Medicago truncatula]|nr:putative pentatricopeptide [Medicago truncatula]